MSHNVTITLPDEIYQPLNEIAGRRGQTLAEFACETLAQSVPQENHSDAEAARKAEELFARHIGAWDSGDPNSADNERIDADLAGEYAGVGKKNREACSPDTSGLLCILDSRDHRHAIAADSYRQSPLLFTTNYVLTEFVALAHVRGIARQRALEFLKDLEMAPRVEVIWIDKGLHERAMLLLDARLDKTYSLCDAVSFVVMRGRALQEALTTDKHFEQEGFARLLHQLGETAARLAASFQTVELNTLARECEVVLKVSLAVHHASLATRRDTELSGLLTAAPDQPSYSCEYLVTHLSHR